MEILISLISLILLKLYLYLTPTLIKKHIPKKRLTAEEIINCKHMKPELYYAKYPDQKPVKSRRRKC